MSQCMPDAQHVNIAFFFFKAAGVTRCFHKLIIPCVAVLGEVYACYWVDRVIYGAVVCLYAALVFCLHTIEWGTFFQ